MQNQSGGDGYGSMDGGYGHAAAVPTLTVCHGCSGWNASRLQTPRGLLGFVLQLCARRGACVLFG